MARCVARQGVADPDPGRVGRLGDLRLRLARPRDARSLAWNRGHGDPTGPGDAPDWPEQAVNLAAALRVATRNGAIANKAGDRSGSLEPGKDADFIVLDRDVFAVPITDVGETRVLCSVVGGAVVLDLR